MPTANRSANCSNNPSHRQRQVLSLLTFPSPVCQFLWRKEGAKVRMAILALCLFVSAFGHAQSEAPVPTRLLVLDKTFNLPILWLPDEPYAPVGDWLTALKIRWVAQGSGLALKLPYQTAFLWTTTSAKVIVNGREMEVAPLLRRGEDWWLPLVSLARLLRLLAVVNPEKRMVKLAALLQSVAVKQVALGWQVSLTFSYRLPTPPKVGTLREPDRVYADFVGAALQDITLPSLPDGSPLSKMRLGQFSNEPLILRFVAETTSPLQISVVGSEIGDEGDERWHLLLFSSEQREQWLGQIRLQENISTRAIFRFWGRFEEKPTVRYEGTTLSILLPSAPLLPLDNASFTDEGLVREARVEGQGTAARLVVTLLKPAQAHWEKREQGVELVIETPFVRPRRVRLIVVDAGHGGKDPGAMSPSQPSLLEKHLTLDIAFRLKRLLEQGGYQVLLTRTDDTYLPLPDRVAIANNAGADAFVSIHLNAFPQPGGQWGTEVYYWTLQSLPLAESIYRHLLTLLGRKGNGIRQRQLYVIRHTFMPSVLVEPCYLNHPEEEALLRQEWFRERIALAIFWGIAEFFGDLPTLQKQGE